MLELILRSGKRAGRSITLPAGDVVIGRDEGCRIRLTSSDVSRRHCVLRAAGESVIIRDLGSRNGTYVNDVPISSPTRLKPGDLLRVGPFLFQVPAAADKRSSDEDITGWLTEEGTVAGGPPPGVTNDTTLVPDLEDSEATGEPSTGEMWVGSSDDSDARSAALQNDPIVNQAAQVIQDYWAAKQGGR